MAIKQYLIKAINKLPYVRSLYQESIQLGELKKDSLFPAGHYYSPIISVDDIKGRQEAVWSSREKDGIAGIELAPAKQAELLEAFSSYYSEIPFMAEKQPGLRYWFVNDFYTYTDGIVLFSVMRHFRPRRIIEIGSGFSSALMLDTNDRFFGGKIDLTFIEPYPEDRLEALIGETNKQRVSVIKSFVQSVPLAIYDVLEAGDILFVDSTHVVKTGSDVNHIVFEILPRLKQGVLIHFHDVFYPFEYPKDWVFRGFNWNEDYFLRSFLMYNQAFEILLFSEYMHKHHPTAFSKMPLAYQNTGGNLWLRKK